MSLILLNSDFETAGCAQYSWNIVEDVEKSTEYSWNILGYVERALGYSWSIKAWVEQRLEYSWNIATWIEKQLKYSWNIFATAFEEVVDDYITSKDFVQDNFSSLKRPKVFYINILNKVIGLRAPIICGTKKALSYSWDHFFPGKALSYLWNISPLKGLSYSWSILPGKALKYSWDNRSPIIEPCSRDPLMAWDDDTSAETIGRNSSVIIAITGTNQPFWWQVEGQGYSLEHTYTSGVTNTLHADATACGTAIINVLGCDFRRVWGYVRGAVGQWVHYSDDICELSGVPAICVKNPSTGWITATGTKGRLQQVDIFIYKGLAGAPGSPGSCSAGEYMDCMLMDDFCDGRWCNECPENVACWEPGDPMYIEYWWLLSRITYQWDCPL